MSTMQEIKRLVSIGKVKLISAAVQDCLDAGEDPNKILGAMIEAMDEVGEKFKNNEIFVPEMLIAAKTMKKGVEILKPHLLSEETGKAGKVIIGTVAGDLHDIGKNLVAMMIESAGFEVIDLGVDISAERFLEAYSANPETKIIALSALLTTTLEAMENTVALLNRQAFRENVRIMVGGAPVTADFAKEIGADEYTPDAASAAKKAKEFMG